MVSGGDMLNDWHKGEDGVYRAEYDAPLTQLFVNGSRAQRARASYEGYFRIEGKSSTDYCEQERQ